MSIISGTTLKNLYKADLTADMPFMKFCQSGMDRVGNVSVSNSGYWSGLVTMEGFGNLVVLLRKFTLSWIPQSAPIPRSRTVI